MEVGKRITFLRDKKGISVNKLATLSGVSQSFLRDIELGNKQPTVESLDYICYGLGISLKEFFNEGEEDPLTLALLKLSAVQREKLAAFLSSL